MTERATPTKARFISTGFQDVWRETYRSDAEPGVYGTTVRFYDPKTDTWRATWMNPVTGAVRQLTGGQVGSDIVLEGKNGNGTQVHWIFSDVKPNSFHWHAEKLVGKEWRTYEDVSAKRMN